MIGLAARDEAGPRLVTEYTVPLAIGRGWIAAGSTGARTAANRELDRLVELVSGARPR
jgi:hypothetical protein